MGLNILTSGMQGLTAVGDAALVEVILQEDALQEGALGEASSIEAPPGKVVLHHQWP